MPQPERSFRTQTAVLWRATGHDDYGQPTIDPAGPVELKVRWNTRRTLATDPQGNQISLDATAVVDRTIKTGSIMWLGTLDEWYGAGSGGTDVELHEVVTAPETKDLKGRTTRQTVGLRRYRSDLPGTGSG